MKADRIAELDEILKFSPKDPGPIQPGLKGWQLGEVAICARCAGRIIGRGCGQELRGGIPYFDLKPFPGCDLAGCDQKEIPGPTVECAWCGAEDETFRNRRGEGFCSKSHRDASGAALRRLLASGSAP